MRSSLRLRTRGVRSETIRGSASSAVFDICGSGSPDATVTSTQRRRRWREIRHQRQTHAGMQRVAYMVCVGGQVSLRGSVQKLCSARACSKNRRDQRASEPGMGKKVYVDINARPSCVSGRYDFVCEGRLATGGRGALAVDLTLTLDQDLERHAVQDPSHG